MRFEPEGSCETLNWRQMVTEFARADDEAEILRLLESAQLPTSDITGDALHHFQVLRDAGALVGVVGLECAGPVALLRSLAVDPSGRGGGAGASLVLAAEAYARRCGVRDIFLLTTSADGYFAARGYRAVGREHAPAAIRQSEQFRSLCPSSSTLMVKHL